MILVKDDSRESRKSYHATFESWSEYLAFVQDAPVGPQFSQSNQQSRLASQSFTKTKDFPEAVKLALDGWQEGTELVKAATLKDFNAVSDKIERPYYVYDVEGSEVDVARFLSGEPEVWMREETRLTDGPGRRVFDLTLNCAVSAGVPTETIMQRGSAIVALIQAMELAGHGVNLTLTTETSGSSWDFENAPHSRVDVPLKSADQPIDLPRLAFAMVHPSSLRRIMFAAWERLPYGEALQVAPHGCYGYPDEGAGQGNTLYFGGAHLDSRNWSDPREVEEWITGTLKAQGISLRGEAS